MYLRILSRCINWTKSHRSCSVKFEEQGDEVWVSLRTWERDIFLKICVATLHCYSLGRIVESLAPDVSVVSISGGWTILVEAFCEYLGSGSRQKLIDYPSFNLHLFKRCLQRTAFSVFGSLDGLAGTESIVNWLKGAETRDWMSSRPDLRKVVLINDLGMPHLVDIVANIIEVWPLIVSYLKKTGRKNDGYSLVVRSSFLKCVSAFSYPCLLYLLF